MSTVEERLREEMARSIAGVRPAPDPYGRLLRRHHRRRSWRWSGAGIGAVVVAALLGTQALTAGGPSRTDGGLGFQPTVSLNDWTRRLIAAPVRGDLAGEAGQFEAALAGARGKWGVDADLDRVKVLFVARAGAQRGFGAAFYNDSVAVYVGSFGPAGASVADLVAAKTSMQTGDVSEFNAVQLEDYTVAFVPPGCKAQTAATSTVRPDGTVEHTWVGDGDFAVLPKPAALWRVVCDGVVRETGFRNLGRGGASAGAGDGLAQCPVLPGFDVREWRVRWGGTPPGERRPVVVALGLLDGGGAEVCAITGTGEAIMVTDVQGYDVPAGLPDYPTAQLTTAVTASDALVAVRLPQDGRAGYSGRLLVVAPPGATRLQVTGGPDALVDLVDGAGVVEAPMPARLRIAALDAAGVALATTEVAEPSGVRHVIAGEPVIQNWG